VQGEDAGDLVEEGTGKLAEQRLALVRLELGDQRVALGGLLLVKDVDQNLGRLQRPIDDLRKAEPCTAVMIYINRIHLL